MFFTIVYHSALIPFPYYSGMIDIITSDNGNIGFQLLIIILSPVIDWINRFESKTIKLILLFILIIILSYYSFSITSILLFFICYESLIIILLLLLYLFIPSYYRLRTAFWLFIISISGSTLFIIAFILFISCSFFLILVLIIPFLIKMPCFHFIIDYLKYIVKLILQYHYYLLV